MARPMLTDEELDRRFNYHQPKTQGRIDAHEAVRAAARECAAAFNALLPAGREAAMAFTALDEAMWAANAALARQPDE